MAFKSEAQRKKFEALVKQGKLPKETLDKWNNDTANKSLPEKAGYKTKSLTRQPRRVRTMAK